MSLLILKDLAAKEVITDSFEYQDRNHFSYIDQNNDEVKVDIYEDGIILLKKAKDYFLTLSLRNDSYALIESNEGKVEIDAKVVEFSKNNDILVMRYLIDDVNKEIVINY